MPTYIYVKEGDETGESAIEKDYPISEFQRRRSIDGEWYVVSAALQQKPKGRKPKEKTGDAGYPYYSDAMSVHPSQVAECQQVYIDAGVGPQEFDRMGRMKVKGETHRRKLMKARGFVDRNSYYGY